MSFLKTFFFALVWFTSLASFSQFHFNGIVKQELKNARKKLKSPPLKTGENIDVSFYELNITVDPTIKYISGTVRILFISKQNDLNNISLNMSSSLILDSVVHNDKKVNVNHQNNILNINLSNSLAISQIDSILIYYQGRPATNGLGTFTQGSYNDKDSIIWTLSEPFGSSEWWPCKDDLQDKADSVDLNIATTLGNQVASIGLLTEIDTNSNYHTYHWKSRYPIATYLIAFAVTNYKIFEDTIQLHSKPLLLQHFQYPNDTVGIYNSLTYVDDFMFLFDSLLGEYPFIKEKYGHASCPFAGGMEHQTMSFMGGYGGEIMAHELAHQWFGNKITCQSWKDLWLNEGFATYLTALTYDFSVVHNRFYWPIFLDGMQRAAFNYPHGSVFRADTTDVKELFNGLVYHKGAYLLHMLRYTVGDSLFFQTLYNYANDQNLSYNFASTFDFKAHLEHTTKQNFDEFFNDWFYGKGFPTYEIYWEQKNDEIILKLFQSQSDPSVYFFNSLVPIKFYSKTWDTTIQFNPRFSGHQFSFFTTHQIDSIQFDPEKWILAKSDILTSTRELTNDNIFKIYPNPSKGKFQLTTTKSYVNEPYKVFSLAGELMKEGYLNEDNQFNIESLAKGVYLFQLSRLHLMRKLIVY